MKDRMFVVQHPTGVVVDVQEKHMRETLAWLSNEPRAERRRILASVEKALENAATLVKTGYATAEDLQDACADVCIWFANEVREGRVDLVACQYKNGNPPTAWQLAKFKKWHSKTTVDDTLAQMKVLRDLRAN